MNAQVDETTRPDGIKNKQVNPISTTGNPS